MQTTSAAWKNAILNPNISRLCKARATISMGVSLVDTSVVISSADTQFPANLQQLVNGVNAPPYAYLALDSVWMIGDGLALSSATAETGFVSNGVSSGGGAFTTPPRITAVFNSAQTIPEVPIAFDAMRHEYAPDFKIEFYDKNGTSLGYWQFTGNTAERPTCVSADAAVDTAGSVVTDVRSMELTIQSWSVGGACARVVELGGTIQERVTGDDRIMTLTVTEQIDEPEIVPGSVNSAKLVMELDNQDNRYTYDAQGGLFFHKNMENKAIWVEFGLQLDPEDESSTEWINGGLFYIQSVEAADGVPSATITAYDMLNVCDAYEYRTQLSEGAHTLQEHGEDMIASLPFAPNMAFDPPYATQYPSSADYPTLPEWPAGTTVRAGLKALMEVSAGQVRQGRDGTVRFLSCMSVDPSDVHDYTGPTLTYDISAVNSAYPITTDALFLPLKDETNKDTWVNQFAIYYGNSGASAWWQYSGSIAESGRNAEFIRDNLFTKSGLGLQGSTPDYLSCACSAWLGLYRYSQIVKAFSYRCDPAIEPGDAVRVYDRLGNYVTGWVMSHTITYSGGFTGEITLRGISRTGTINDKFILGQAILGQAVLGKS